MTEQLDAVTLYKDATIWSSRRGCPIQVRIVYQMREENGCKIYRLRQVEELEIPV